MPIHLPVPRPPFRSVYWLGLVNHWCLRMVVIRWVWTASGQYHETEIDGETHVLLPSLCFLPQSIHAWRRGPVEFFGQRARVMHALDEVLKGDAIALGEVASYRSVRWAHRRLCSALACAPHRFSILSTALSPVSRSGYRTVLARYGHIAPSPT